EGIDVATLALNAGLRTPANFELSAEQLAGQQAALELSRLNLRPFISVMMGLEFDTPLGHFNSFPVVTPRPWLDDRFMNVLHKTPTAEQMLRYLHEDPGDEIVQINHPRYGAKGGYFSARVDPDTSGIKPPFLDMNFDQIEVFNAYIDKEVEWIGRTPKVN